MIILDENLPDSQRQLLKGWRISFRQIGFEIGREGMKDDEIIPLLHGLNRPTFFTLMKIFQTRIAPWTVLSSFPLRYAVRVRCIYPSNTKAS